MKLGIRWRLFAVSVALVGVVGLASGVYMELSLRALLEGMIQDELERQAQVVVAAVQLAQVGGDIEQADALADRLGAAAEARVTLIDPDGRVIGDSEVPTAQVAALANHGQRPEVLQAAVRGMGDARRRSTTVGRDSMYVAVAYEGGFVRTAMPLDTVAAAVNRLRLVLAVGGLIGLLLAGLLSALASRWMTTGLLRIVDRARRLARGEAIELPRQEAGELGGLAGSLNQLSSELQRAVGELADERTRTRAVLEGMREAVIAVDDHRRVSLVNAAALRLLRLDSSPAGRALVEAVRLPGLIALADGALAGEAGTAEMVFHGAEPPATIKATATPKRGGGCVLVIRDVTRLRNLERVRSDFVANVSHELRTPVSAVRASAEALRDGAMADPVHGPRFLDAVLRNAERLGTLIDDLLALSRVEAGASALELVPVGLLEAVHRALDPLAERAREKQQIVAVEVDPELRVRADPGALERVLGNLLDNATKYTPSGGHVAIRARAEEAGVLIEVLDDGPGVPEPHRPRLFERFYRVDPGRSRAMGGTGLGLSIVRHMVRAMGGEEGMRPNLPRGSVFFVRLGAA